MAPGMHAVIFPVKDLDRAEELQAPKDVAGGTLVATARDADGNVIGLRQAS